jgi:hypothetical protein
LGGTSPAYTLAAGATALFRVPSGATISSSATNATFTPAATGNMLVTVCGA